MCVYTVSQEYQFMHIPDSHTNGKYAQDSHMVLSVCREKRTNQKVREGFSEKYNVIKLRSNGRKL